MKKILICLLLITFLTSGKWSVAQPTKPTGAVSVPTYSIFRTPADSVAHIYMGSVIGFYSFRMLGDTTKLHTGVATLYRLSKTIQAKDSATNVKGYKSYYSARVQDVTTNATYYPLFTTATSGQYLAYVTSSKLSYNPSTGILVTTNFQLSSDSTLKKNIQQLTEYDYLKAKLIPYVKFEWKDDRKDKPIYGFLAQDVEKVYPDMVGINPITGKKSVDYTQVMIAKIAYLEHEIELLKKNKKDKWRAEKCTVNLP